MNTLGVCLFNGDVAILAIGFSLHISHPFIAGRMAVYAVDPIFIMHIGFHTGRNCVISPDIRLTPPALHGPGMTHATAAESTATFRFRNLGKFMGLPLLWRIMAVQATGMTCIANSLLILCLLVGERHIEILADPFCISVIKTGDNQNFRWGKIGKRRTAVVRTVRIHPCFHCALTEIGSHQSGTELL